MDSSSSLLPEFPSWYAVFVYALFFIAIIFIWRGIWNLIDMYVSPKSPLFSQIISIIIGLVLALLALGISLSHVSHSYTTQLLQDQLTQF